MRTLKNIFLLFTASKVRIEFIWCLLAAFSLTVFIRLFQENEGYFSWYYDIFSIREWDEPLHDQNCLSFIVGFTFCFVLLKTIKKYKTLEGWKIRFVGVLGKERWESQYSICLHCFYIYKWLYYMHEWRKTGDNYHTYFDISNGRHTSNVFCNRFFANRKSQSIDGLILLACLYSYIFHTEIPKAHYGMDA